MTIQSDSTRAQFAEESGRLVGLTASATGWNIVGDAVCGLSFGMLVPTDSARSTYIIGESQNRATVERRGNESIVFTWRGLTDENGQTLDIAFAGTIAGSSAGLVFSGEITNNTGRVIEAVAWPCVGGLIPQGPGGSLVTRQMRQTSLTSSPLYPRFFGRQGYWGTYYPTEGDSTTIDSLFILIEEDGQGVYVGCEDASGETFVRWFFQQRPGLLDSYDRRVPSQSSGSESASLELLVQHFPFVKPGASHSLPPIMIDAYQGSWQAGADRYRSWRSTWFRAPQRPAWVEDIHSWLQIQIYGSEDRVNFRYTDLPAIATECRKNGITAIQLTGWARGGQDRGNPSHDVEPELGSREELADAIGECEEMGVHVVLFCKFTWIDQGDARYEELVAHTAKNRFGRPYHGTDYRYYSWTQLAGITTRPLIPTCTASPEWRAIAVEEFKKAAALGASGMLYDEAQHHGQALFCFDSHHSHELPAFLYAYDCRQAQEFKEAVQRINPDFLFAAEACYDVEMTEYHLLYTRFNDSHIPCARYIDSHLPIMMAVPGLDDRNKLNKCLEYRYIISYEPLNFKGRPSDAPLTIAYGRLIDGFRRRYRRFLWDGEFLGVSDTEVSVNGKQTVDFSAYGDASGNRHAIVVCNIDHYEPAMLSVTFEQTNAPLAIARPEEPDPVTFEGETTIPPRSLVLIGEMLE